MTPTLSIYTLTRPTDTTTTDTHTWRDQAECRDEPPALFDDPAYTELAQSICARCPVKMTCAEAALEEEAGAPEAGRATIRGGLTPRERASLYRAKKRKEAKRNGPPPGPIPHGTPAGYRAHRRRHEDACEACRQAETRRTQDRERARREATA